MLFLLNNKVLCYGSPNGADIDTVLTVVTVSVSVLGLTCIMSI